MSTVSSWTTERSDALREHIAAGLSYTEAAQEINQKFKSNYSRNATIGRGARMGLKAPTRPGDNMKKPIKAKRPQGEARPRQDVTMQARASAPPVLPRAEVELRCAEIEPRLIALIDLEPNECRYPYGEDSRAGYLFCGHRKDGESSYCSAHHALILRPVHPNMGRDRPDVTARLARANSRRPSAIKLASISEREEIAS